VSGADETARLARRTGLIVAAIILGAVALTLAWLVPEGLRIARNRDTRLRDSAAGSDMVRVSGASFTMGANDGAADEQPLHDVRVSEFWMDRNEVTNEEFARFVKATAYITTVEKSAAGSWCFRPEAGAEAGRRRTWMALIPGANWLQPRGQESMADGWEKRPVVHVSHDDANAYCKWAHKRLPTEAEWECAARGGQMLTRYPWGNGIGDGGPWQANLWQGKFPEKDDAPDGFAGPAPVGSFPPNGFGFRDLAGNVAEWCADWYQHDYYAQLRPDPIRAAHRNPKGPDSSVDPGEPGVSKRVVRGGSWLSDAVECRVSARGREAPDFTAEWIGFRCVKDVQ